MSRNTGIAAVLEQLATILAEQRHEPPREPPAPRPMPERVLLTVDEAAERLGIGRTSMFRLVRIGEVESVTIGRLRRIPATAINEYATRLVAKQRAEQAA